MSQQTLPFAAAEGTYGERQSMIRAALAKVQCDLHLREFVRLVFETTQGGTHGSLRKTYRELSYRPLWLCCSHGMARQIVTRAIRLGMVSSQEDRYATGCQGPNCYTINWAGIKAICAAKADTSATKAAHNCPDQGGRIS